MITIITDIAADEDGPDTILTVARLVDTVRQQADLSPDAVFAVAVKQWVGPGGGNPEIEVTFRERADAEAWVAMLSSGDGKIDWRGHVTW